MRKIRLRLKHWRVGHVWQFVRNIYGDEINYADGMRSVYRCDCGKVKYCPSLHGSFQEEE